MEFHGIEKLKDAENWNAWKFAMRNLLRGIEGAYEVCLDEITKPLLVATEASAEQRKAYHTGLKTWDKTDRAASQVIVRTLEAKVMALLVKCETAREIWLKLHAIFEQQIKQAAHVVQAEFFNFNMDPTQDMVTNIAKFEGLTLRMQQLNVKFDESSLVVKLLDTLPDEYENLRQAWWARSEEQQTFENLVEVLTSEESRRKQRAGRQEEATALLTNKNKTQGKKEFSSKKQQSRKFNGSEINKNKDKPSFKCYKCGGKGHIRRNCPSDKQKKRSEETGASESNNNEEAFTCEAMNIELDDDAWIVDSGATDHVTNCSKWFSLFQAFEIPIKIHIGNKSNINALGKGTIKFEAFVNGQWLSCKMENVLYVPVQ